MSTTSIIPADVSFVRDAVRDFALVDPVSAKVLDFGCGRGVLVDGLCAHGVDAYGCDVDPYWEGEKLRLRPIQRSPYRIPYDDNSFDVVISTSVLEYAHNPLECFYEIKRVLRPGGSALHIYPSKGYLPLEPHIFVPLVNFLWPNQPRWWLAFWAFLGVRNKFQQGMNWHEATEANFHFCNTGVCYLPKAFYRRASMEVFGNFDWPMHYFLTKSHGGYAALYRRLPLKGLIAWGASILGRQCWCSASLSNFSVSYMVDGI